MRRVSFDGAFVQNPIYIGRQEHPWPLTAAGWEERGREAIPEGNFGYIAGGAGAESTMRANLEAFDRLPAAAEDAARERAARPLGRGARARARRRRSCSRRSASSRSRTRTARSPCARAAAATGVPFILSSAASHSIEEVAEAMGDAPRWFQLYWINDREVCASFVRRAEANGYARDRR